MTTGQLAALTMGISLVSTVALSYFGVPARINCTIAAASHTVAYALTAPL